MAQAETAAYGNQVQRAQQARSQAIGGIFSGIAQAGIAGLQAGAFDNIGTGRLNNVGSQDNSLGGISYAEGYSDSTNPNQMSSIQDINMPDGTNLDDFEFSQAFAEGRRRHGGPGGTFMWRGNLYTTDRADD